MSRRLSEPTNGLRMVTNDVVDITREPLKARHQGQGDIEMISDLDCERLVLEQVSAIDFSVPTHEHLPPPKRAMRELGLPRNHHEHHHMNGYKLDRNEFNNKGFHLLHDGTMGRKYVTTGTSPMLSGSPQTPVTQTDLNHYSPHYSSSHTTTGQTTSSQLPSPSSPSSLSPVSPHNPMDMSVTSSTTGSDNDRNRNGSPKCQEKESSPGPKALSTRPHVLPPCRVCGAPATGFHYGANTCEACKVSPLKPVYSLTLIPHL